MNISQLSFREVFHNLVNIHITLFIHRNIHLLHFQSAILIALKITVHLYVDIQIKLIFTRGRGTSHYAKKKIQ